MINQQVRSELKKVVASIETLAHQALVKIDNGEDVLTIANELIKNSVTATFILGEVYALESQTSSVASSTAKVKRVVNSSNWHNVRDSRGRFVTTARP